MYKSFALIRTGFLALVLALFCAFPAKAQSDLFTVGDIIVDISAENAIKAREQAFAQAQVDAFKAMAARMMPEAEATAFTPPEAAVISPMILDFEVTKEQLSSTRYVGTYLFRFDANAVKSYFGSRNVSYSDTKSRPVLVLPFMEAGGKMHLWSPFNVWMKAWGRAKNLQSGLVPLVLPLGDLADVADIGDDDALTYNPAQLAKLVSRYETGEAVIVIARMTPALAADGVDTAPAQGTLTMQLYRTDAGAPTLSQDLSLSASEGETLATLMDKGAENVKAALQSNWKAQTAVRGSDMMRVQAKTPFTSLGQWTDTKRALDRVYGIENLRVVTITPQGANVDFSFRGDETRLREALAQAGLTLAAGAPTYVPGSMPGSMPIPGGYEIYLARAGSGTGVPPTIPQTGPHAVPFGQAPVQAPVPAQAPAYNPYYPNPTPAEPEGYRQQF